MYRTEPSAVLQRTSMKKRPSALQSGKGMKRIPIPIDELTKEMKKVGRGINLAGSGIHLAGGRKKRMPRKPKSMPKPIAAFIKKHPKLSLSIVQKLMKGQGGEGLGELALKILNAVTPLLKAGAKKLITYAMENPDQVIKFIKLVISAMGELSSKEESSDETAGLELIDPFEAGSDEAPDVDLSGDGLKKIYKKAKKAQKKTRKTIGRVGAETMHLLKTQPSKPLGLAGTALGLAGLAQPELLPVAAGLKGTSALLKMAGKGKRKLSAYNKHMSHEMKEGATMKQAAASWRAMKK